MGATSLVLALTIDNWSRDFTGYRAEVALSATDPQLKPYVSRRPVEDLVLALKWSAHRIGNLQFVGTGSKNQDTYVIFVKRGRILRFLEDDVRMRVRDRGTDRIVTGESQARWAVGDLGRNPRNLRRIMAELETILKGAE